MIEAKLCGPCCRFDSSPINDMFTTDGTLLVTGTGERWVSLPDYHVDGSVAHATVSNGRLTVAYADVSAILGDILGVDPAQFELTVEVGGAAVRWDCRCGTGRWYVQANVERLGLGEAFGVIGWASSLRHIHEGEIVALAWVTDRAPGQEVMFPITTGTPPSSGPNIALAFDHLTGVPGPVNGQMVRLEWDNGTMRGYVGDSLYGWTDGLLSTVDPNKMMWVGLLGFKQNETLSTFGAFGAGCLS